MIQTLLLAFSAGLVFFGTLVMTIAVYGLIRMPDVYTRLHAASKGAVLGVIPILAGSMFTGDVAVISRAILVAAFLLITTPIASSAIGRAAFLVRQPMASPDFVDESHGFREGPDEGRG